MFRAIHVNQKEKQQKKTPQKCAETPFTDSSINWLQNLLAAEQELSGMSESTQKMPESSKGKWLIVLDNWKV